MSTRRIRVAFTKTAEDSFAKLPKSTRKGFGKKIDDLRDCTDPRQFGKPLTESLIGYYSLRFSRYRAVYLVEDEELANGDVLTTVKVLFVLFGLRKEDDRKDVYRLAARLAQMGLLKEPPTP